MKTPVVVFLAALLFAAGALAQTASDLNAGSQVAFSGTGGFTFSWWGTSGNTYLIQTSDDLIHWTYVPIVEYGADSPIEWGFSSNSSSLFLQLEYITVPASQMPPSAFDGPIDSASGLPGDWELFYFGVLGVDPGMDPNGDGFTTLQDYENGNNPVANPAVTAGPAVGEYLLHETSGTVAHDISSLHNNGQLSGGATWTGTNTGYDGLGSILFNGTNGQVTISDTANQVLPSAGAPFSFALWLAPNASRLAGTTTLITDQASGSGFVFAIDPTTSPPSLLFVTPGAGGIDIEAPFQPTGWTQAAVTYDGTNATLYVNGSEAVSGTGTLTSNTNAITLANGLSGDEAYPGAMEDLTFYQALLGSWDVTSLYNLSNTSTGPDPSGLPDWWKFQYFGTLNVNPNASVAWDTGQFTAPPNWDQVGTLGGGQVTVEEAYQNGWNPLDYYNGQKPNVTIFTGNNQIGADATFLPAPLVVTVTDTNNNPLVGAPVAFSSENSGWFGVGEPSDLGSYSNAVLTFTDSNGQARAYVFSAISSASVSTGFAAIAGPPGNQATVVFTESTGTGGLNYPSPFAPSNVTGAMNSDGSETVTWQNNDTTDPVSIYAYTSGSAGSSGTWDLVTTVAPSVATFTATGSQVGNIAIVNALDLALLLGSGGSGGSGGGVGLAGAPGAAYVPIPTQTYPDIDVTGGNAGSGSVNLVALSDSNQMAFELTSPDRSQYTSYTWASGTTTQVVSIPAGSGDTQVELTGITSSGGLYAISATASGEFFSTDSPTRLTLPPNFVGGIVGADFGNDAGYCGTEVSGTPGSSFASSGGMMSVAGTMSIFDPNLSDSEGGPGVQICNFLFVPAEVIPDGCAIGTPRSVGTDVIPEDDPEDTPEFWDGSPADPPIALPGQFAYSGPNGALEALNNQNYVLLNGSSGGLVWALSTSSSQPIQSLIPQQYQGQVSQITARAISNQNPNDNTINILFDAQYLPDPGQTPAMATFVLTVTASNQGALSSSGATFAQIELPDGESPEDIQSINSSGILSVIYDPSNNQSEAAFADAAPEDASPASSPSPASIRPPVQVGATNLGGTLSAPTGWQDASNGGFMGSWEFQVSATTPSLAGISIGVVRDVEYTDTITYEDGSLSQCKSASSSSSVGGFLPDSPYPNFAGTAGSTTSQTTDSHGNLVFSGSDNPDITLTQTERPYVIKVQDVVTAANFVVAQVGAGAPQVLTQVNWSYSNTANFTRSPMGETFSTEWKGNQQLIPNPTAGQTIHGTTPSAQPITANRNPTAAFTYFDTPGNWKAIGQPGQMAFKYSRNP